MSKYDGWHVQVYRGGVWERPKFFSIYDEARDYFLGLQKDTTVRASGLSPCRYHVPVAPSRRQPRFLRRLS